MIHSPSPVFAAACTGMLLFGVTLTTLGAVLPSLMPRYGLDRTSAGSLLSLMSLGILVASMVFGPIVDRRGYKGVLIIAALGVLIGLEGIALAPTSAFLGSAVFLFGLSGGMINGSTNALVSEISEQGRESGLSLLGVFFGIGALGVPLIFGLLLGSVDYTTILTVFGLVVFLPLGMFVSIQFPAPKQPHGFPIRKAAALLSERTLLVLGLMLFCQSGMEITLGGWSSQFVHEALGLDQGRAVLVLSFFWVGMMTARLIMIPLLKQWSLFSVLALSWAFSASGFLFLWLARGEKSAMLGLFLYGFGLAAGFPVILGVIGEMYQEMTGTAFSIVFVMALLGGSVLPLLTGFLGDSFDLRTSLQTVPFAGMVQILLFAVVTRPGAPYRSLFLKRKDDIPCSHLNG